MKQSPIDIDITLEPDVYNDLSQLAESLDYESVKEFIENMLRAMA
jgi:hypothetical protein